MAEHQWAAKRARGVPASLIRKMFDLAQDVPGAISLAVGEPDFPTPSHIIEAGQRALDEGWTRYSPNAGYRELREAIAEKLRKVNGLQVDPATQIFVTVGAMEALMLTFLVALDPAELARTLAPTRVDVALDA